jgi:hypothetical protein
MDAARIMPDSALNWGGSGMTREQCLYYRAKRVWRQSYRLVERNPGTTAWGWFKYLTGRGAWGKKRAP